MEKMIKVINDNLGNVIIGIKEHRADLEKALEEIRNDMAVRVKEANSYKSEVEKARTIVYSLENEIADLEKDLSELNSKFGAKDFKAILDAGNKEITSKINEKKSLINEQGKVILALTEKARNLKDSLIELREKKIIAEDNLNKTKILESYYEIRINEIVKYAEENPGELANYREEVPQEELNIQEDIDITGVIDGSIFEEIDEISNGEPNPELLHTVLSNPEEIPEYEEEKIEEAPVSLDVKTANQLENMISEAKSFVEKKKMMVDPASQAQALENVETETEEKEEEEPEQDLGYIDLSTFENDESSDDDASIFLDIDGLQKELDEDKNEEENDDTINIEIEDDDAEEVNLDSELVTSEDTFSSEENVDIQEELKKYNLNSLMFKQDELAQIKANFNKNNFKEFIHVMEKHNINLENLYDNGNVLVSITPQNLNHLLTLLEKTDGNNTDINQVFKYLDKVNINKLEHTIMTTNEPSLTSSLADAIKDVDNTTIIKVLNLSKKAEEALKKAATIEELRIMNALPDVILDNYREIKALNVNNLEECISKYPHRFTLPHSVFHDILDKYDTEDLVRCINKNAAVIDKL